MDQEDLRERYGWKKVVAPKAWRPEATGEELIGFYGGKTTRTGAYGQYDVVLVSTRAGPSGWCGRATWTWTATSA